MSDTNGNSATSPTQNTSLNQSSNVILQEIKVQEQQPLLAEQQQQQQKTPSINQIFNSTLNPISSNPILPSLQQNDIHLQQLQSQLAQSALLQLIQTQPLLKQQLQTQFVQDPNVQTNQPSSQSSAQPIDDIKPISPSMPTLSHLVNQSINRMPHSKTVGSLGRQTNFLIGSANNNKPVNKRKEEFHYYYNKCMRTISHSINIIKAVTMRLVFSLHSLIAIVYVYLVREDEWYFVNVIGVVFMLIEVLITVIKRKGKEPRWSVFHFNSLFYSLF